MDTRTNEQLISAMKQKMSAETLAAASNFKVEFCQAMGEDGRFFRFKAVTWDTTQSNRHGFLSVKFI